MDLRRAPPPPDATRCLEYLDRMGDETGLFQHATYDVPNRSHGYCTDDIARALRLVVAVANRVPRPDLIARYLGFLAHAYDTRSGRFRNFLSFDRRWRDELGSDACHGRAMQALAAIVAMKPSTDGNRRLAEELFLSALPAALEFQSLRGRSFGALASDVYLKAGGNTCASALLESTGSALRRASIKEHRRDWAWFEDSLTFFNALLPCAALVCGRHMGDAELVVDGLTSLGWLCEQQTVDSGFFSPIGNEGWYSRGSDRAVFDQQPIEAYATIAACNEAFAHTKNERWKREAQRAYAWYFGKNALGRTIVDLSSNGCRDGLGRASVNENQGAESTVTFWLATLHMAEYA